MKRLKTYFFVLIFFFVTTAAYAGNFYSQAIGKLEKGLLVVTTLAQGSQGAQRALNARKSELTDFGVAVTQNKFLAGATYEKEFGPMFQDLPAALPYLSLNDSRGREVRVQCTGLDAAEALTQLTVFEEKYKTVQASDIKMIQKLDEVSAGGEIPG